MSDGPERRRERLWVVASGVLLMLALLPWWWLPQPLEAVLPVALILLGPAPWLAAMSRGGGFRRGCAWTVVWWGLAGSWVLAVDPLLGCFAFLGMLFVALTLTAPLILVLLRLRERHGPEAMLRLAPAAWVAWELFRTWPPLGASWGCLYHALWRLPAAFQVAELTGCGPLTFAIACASAGLARRLVGRPDGGRQTRLGLGLLAGCTVYGAVRIATFDASAGRPVETALVQANVPVGRKSTETSWELFELNRRLTLAAPRRCELVVWAETAVPNRVWATPYFRRSLQYLARSRGATLIIGAVDTAPPGDPAARIVTNAAFVIGPDGALRDVYHKVRLVVFGEYTPFREHRWAARIAEQSPQYWAGLRHRAVATPFGRLGVPICYESVFPPDVRAMVKDGALALVVITNDALFTQVGGREHFQQAVFRCVENRRWMARCANTGISAFIDPAGRVVRSSSWGVETVPTGIIHLRHGLTPYTRTGDLFGWLCLVLVLVACVAPPRTSGQESAAVGEPTEAGDGR